MSDCCCEKTDGCCKSGCNFDSDMILWVLIIIVIVSCMKNN